MMQIYNKDCFDFFAETPSNFCNHIFTSPPYNRKRNDKYELYDDTVADYYQFIEKLAIESLRISREFVFINIQKNYYNKKDVFNFIGKFSEQIKEIFIWNKSNPMPASGNNITNGYEFVFAMSKHDKSLKSNKTYTINSFTTSVAKMSKSHKAIMNQKVSDFFIANFTKENDLIIDPMCGLGTTGLSCKKFNRKFIGIELIPEYSELAKTRVLTETTSNKKEG